MEYKTHDDLRRISREIKEMETLLRTYSKAILEARSRYLVSQPFTNQPPDIIKLCPFCGCISHKMDCIVSFVERKGWAPQ